MIIRAIVVDGDKKESDKLCRMLAAQPCVMVAGEYRNPEKVLDDMDSVEPHVVFLDIDLPGFNGRELAEVASEIGNRSAIVYVTAYGQFAIDAFGDEAVDFLIKPITEGSLIQALYRLKKRFCREVKMRLETINILGTMKLLNAEGEIIEVDWQTDKTRELFALLVHQQGEALPEESIIKLLWPALDCEKGSRVFHITVQYLRKALQSVGLPDALRLPNGLYVLELGGAVCDADEFERSAVKKGDDISGETELLKRAIDIYHGDYFEGDNFHWSTDRRSWLRGIYFDLLKQEAEEQVPGHAFDVVLDNLEKLLRYNPLNEEAQFMLMDVIAERGDRKRLVRQFDDYKRVLKEETGSDPEREMRLHFYNLLKKCWERAV